MKIYILIKEELDRESEKKLVKPTISLVFFSFVIFFY